LDFPTALAFLLKGKRIANSNWKGSGAYLFSLPGYVSTQANEMVSKAANIELGTKICIAPYLMRCNAAGVFVPYTITNVDVYSDDWYIWGD
jgi:Protein of unknown function (DUF2829)